MCLAHIIRARSDLIIAKLSSYGLDCTHYPDKTYNKFMANLLSAFFTSFLLCLALILYQKLSKNAFGSDYIDGPQKVHTKSTSRLGGIGIFLGLASAIGWKLSSNPEFLIAPLLLLCALPAFGIGLLEDIKQNVGVTRRMLVIASAAVISCLVLNFSIEKTGIPGIDFLLTIPLISLLFTAFTITGLTNAYNIIDGFNGLASMVAIITLLSLAYLGYTLEDFQVVFLCLALASGILGFFFWNYPFGNIFLGDCGAYLIGFWIAVISILLVSRHSEISPWFAALVNAYPIQETFFSIYRRNIKKGGNLGQADGMHLHTLLYRRILNSNSIDHKHLIFTGNSRTSPYLWILSSLSIFPALIWRQSTPMLIFWTVMYVAFYIWLYRSMVTFKIPSWLRLL